MPNIQVVPAVTSNKDFPIDLRDLESVSGMRQHSELLSRFVTYCKITKTDDSFCSNTYQDVNNRTFPTASMTEQQARFFMAYLDPVTGRKYAETLEAKVTQQQEAILKLETAKVAQLTSQIATLQAKPAVVLAMSSKVNRRSIHQMRRDLFDMGMCNMDYQLVKHYKFSVTTKGFSNGYEENDKGDIII